MRKYSALVVYFLVFGAFVLLAPRSEHKFQDYEIYTAFDHVTQAPRAIRTIPGRHWIQLPFYFEDQATSPYKFTINLKPIQNKGLRSLWIFSTQETRQGQLSVEYNGHVLKEVNNRLDNQFKGELHYIGDIDIQSDSLVLNFTSIRGDLPTHAFELGFLVLTPPQTDKAAIEALFSDLNSVNTFDYGTYLALFMLSFLFLMWFSRVSLVTRYGISDGGICSTLVILSFSILSIFILFSQNPSLHIYTSQIYAPKYNQFDGSTDRFMDQKIQFGRNFLRQLINGNFKNISTTDVVPDQFKKGQGQVETTIFYKQEAVVPQQKSSGIVLSLIGQVQNLTPGTFILFGLFLLAGALIISTLASTIRSVLWAPTGLIFISLLSTFLTFRLATFQDSTFLSLRHAQTLAQSFTYGINANQWIEGSSEFLQIIIITLYTLCGGEPLNAYLILWVASFLYLNWALFRLAVEWSYSIGWSLFITLFLSFFPLIFGISLEGCSLFFLLGTLLTAIYYLSYPETGTKKGIFCLALLPFIRFDGFFYSISFFIYFYLIRALFSAIKNHSLKLYFKGLMQNIALWFLPLAALCGIRYLLFGSVFPISVLYTFTEFDRSFAEASFQLFYVQFLQKGLPILFLGLFLFAILRFISLWISRIERFHSIFWDGLFIHSIIIGLVSFFIINGGNGHVQFLPQNVFVLCVILCLFLFSLIYRTCYGALREQAASSALIMGLFVLGVLFFHFQNYYSLNSFQEPFKNLLTASTSFDNALNTDRIKKSNGKLLKKVLPRDWSVATAQSYMVAYYAENPLHDLLGTANVEIVHQPLQMMFMEQPFYHHRALTNLYHNRPNIILIDRNVIRGDFLPSPHLQNIIRDHLRFYIFNPEAANSNFYHFGSMAALHAMGYRHITIVRSDSLMHLVIQENTQKEFLNILEEEGFREIGREKLNFDVAPFLFERLNPSVPELFPRIK